MDFDRMYSYSVCLEEYFYPPQKYITQLFTAN